MFGELLKLIGRVLERLSKEQLYRLSTGVIIASTGLLGVVVALAARTPEIDSTLSPILATAVAFSTVTIVAAYMLAYLRRTSRTSISTSRAYGEAELLDNLSELQDRITELSQQEFLHPLHLSEDERKQLISGIKHRFRDHISKELVAEFDSKYSVEVLSRLQIQALQDVFESTRDRLRSEIDSLDKRGNLNLVLGSVTTLVGLILLGVFVFTTPSDSTANIAAFHVPRITLVIFIQVFGFFFLRLYRSSLDGIKYFQNELTNLEHKYMALTAAIAYKNDEALHALLGELGKTERNFVLNKGQTTVELEKARLENNQAREALDFVTRSGTNTK